MFLSLFAFSYNLEICEFTLLRYDFVAIQFRLQT